MIRLRPRRMVEDATGRFPARPVFGTTDMDHDCERIVMDFLMDRHGQVRYPLATDDLTALIERDTEDLDLYADLRRYGDHVEGVTIFNPGGKPSVKISRGLTVSRRQVNRYRSTLAHEYAHVLLHASLFDDSAGRPVSERTSHGVDWMEWQANYAAFALLMPKTGLALAVEEHADEWVRYAPPQAASAEGVSMIRAVSQRFAVSGAAARIRLEQHFYLQIERGHPGTV